MKFFQLMRVVILSGLVYGAYTETGLFTALCLGAILLEIEGRTFLKEKKGPTQEEVSMRLNEVMKGEHLNENDK